MTNFTATLNFFRAGCIFFNGSMHLIGRNIKNRIAMRRFIFVIMIALAGLVGYAQPKADTAVAAAADSVAVSAFTDAQREELRELIDDNQGGYGAERQWSPQEVKSLVSTVLGILVPGAVLIVLAIVLGVVVVKTRRAKYRMMDKAIDSSYDVPDYVFTGSRREGTAADGRRNLHSGFVLVAVGLAMFLFFIVNDHIEMSMLMLIPLLIGAGKVAMAFYGKKNAKTDNQRNADETPDDAQQN